MVCSDRLLEKRHTSITRDSLRRSRASQHIGLRQLEEMPGNAAKLLSLPSSRSVYTQSWTSEYPGGRRDLSVTVDPMTRSACFRALLFLLHYALFLPSCQQLAPSCFQMPFQSLIEANTRKMLPIFPRLYWHRIFCQVWCCLTSRRICRIGSFTEFPCQRDSYRKAQPGLLEQPVLVTFARKRFPSVDRFIKQLTKRL